MVERIAIKNREEWLKLRRQDVTASAIAALFGLHPYQTVAGLVLEKSGADIGPKPESKVMRRGRWLESAVAHAAHDERPAWLITKAEEYLRDPALRLGATPDFYYADEKGQRGVMQTKTVNQWEFKRNWTEDGPPLWIALQTLTEMALAEVEIGTIAALVIGPFDLDLQLYEVPRNARAEKRLRDAVAKFWDDCDNLRPPTIDYERDRAVVDFLYPHAKPNSVIDLRADPGLPELLAEREALMAQIKKADDRKQSIETELRAKIGEFESGLVHGWRVSLRDSTRKAYSVPEATFRRLSVSRHTDKEAA
jgi:predicted phage-related endonuclease